MIVVVVLQHYVKQQDNKFYTNMNSLIVLANFLVCFCFCMKATLVPPTPN